MKKTLHPWEQTALEAIDIPTMVNVAVNATIYTIGACSAGTPISRESQDYLELMDGYLASGEKLARVPSGYKGYKVATIQAVECLLDGDHEEASRMARLAIEETKGYLEWRGVGASRLNFPWLISLCSSGGSVNMPQTYFVPELRSDLFANAKGITSRQIGICEFRLFLKAGMIVSLNTCRQDIDALQKRWGLDITTETYQEVTKLSRLDSLIVFNDGFFTISLVHH